MTRDDLIEILARWRYESSLESMIAGATWERASAYGKAAFLAEARDFAPDLVAFVGEWITEQRDRLRNPTDGIVLLALTDVWREEMGT